MNEDHRGGLKVFGTLAAVLVLLVIAWMIAGCATTSEVPAPLVGEVKSQTVYVPVIEPCTDPNKWPKRPAKHAAPIGSDGVRIVRGLRADAVDIDQYATDLEDELRRCSSIPEAKAKGGSK